MATDEAGDVALEVEAIEDGDAAAINLSTEEVLAVSDALDDETGEAREAGPNVVVDLHNQEFCVDVSTFSDVTFEPTMRDKCETTFQKNCETKSDQVSELLIPLHFDSSGCQSGLDSF